MRLLARSSFAFLRLNSSNVPLHYSYRPDTHLSGQLRCSNLFPLNLSLLAFDFFR
ncbi:hypothetical protein PTUN_b0211 [Pseudoalteromonas tunicata]|nr:hypothetical protein PTUN_b0211 [Pseudoalteromonas tunicata]